MESIKISNMKSINDRLNREFIKAMQQEEFKNLINRLHVREDVLKKNVSKLEDTVLELKNCKNCKGLYECRNSYEGHINFPEKYENKIKFIYTPCKYLKKSVEDKKNKFTSKSELESARMKDIDIKDKKRVNLIKWLKNFYDKYDPNETHKGLYLHGSFGAGKTFLISALFNELEEKKSITKEIIYFPELLRSLRDDFDLLEAKLEYLKKVDLLLIDDIGAEKVTEWGRDEILGTILQYRMNECLTTFFTSNLNITELENHLAITKNNEDFVKARRIIQRINQLTEKLCIESENKRK